MTDAGGGRFARWSQRKAAARHGDARSVEPDEAQIASRAEDRAQPAAPTRQDAVSAAPEITKNPETVMPAGENVPVLPPIEGLTFQSDYTAFMAKHVPEALRRAALRKLWVSDPVLANLDGLNDYCEDLNIVDTPITLAQTNYQVGRGYLDEIVEKPAEPGAAQPGAEPEKVSNSHATPDQSDATATTLSESDAAVEEEPAAVQQVAAASPDRGTPERDEDAPT